jgi:hypothetical protein
LIISNENPKYAFHKYANVNKNEVDPDPADLYNTYCMANPFRAHISETNRLFLTYKTLKATSKPLVFDLGYFSYKSLYDDFDSSVDVDFAKLIPSNIGPKTKLNSLEIKIALANRTNYVVPVISACNFRVEQGEVVLKTSTRSIPLNMLACGNVSYTTMLSMESELKLEFKNVLLKELRDKSIRFRIDYEKLPRVFYGAHGSFETNNFKHDYISITRDRVEYEWVIKVSPNDMIRLKGIIKQVLKIIDCN